MDGLLDPKLDYIFKNIFGIETNKHVLISFLNALLKCKPPIKSLTLTNTAIAKILEEDKASRLDVRATCDDGTEIDIEIQIKNTGEIPERALYYLARMVPEALGAGQTYKSYKVIGIWILGENIIPDCEDAVTNAYMTYQQTPNRAPQVMAESLRLMFVELPKFKPKSEEMQELLTAWLLFLKNPGLLDQEFLEVQEIKDAMSRLQYISGDKDVRAIAQLRQNTINDRISEYNTAAAKGKAEGIAEGKAEGKAEGIAEGIAIGEEKGKAEGIVIGEEKGKAEGIAEGIAMAKKELAIKMLEQNVSLENIVAFTGLPIEEINALKKTYECREPIVL
jgi:predicted transposase/invertase (TIGR01784 family)